LGKAKPEGTAGAGSHFGVIEIGNVVEPGGVQVKILQLFLQNPLTLNAQLV
jgi:hypothetical protein